MLRKLVLLFMIAVTSMFIVACGADENADEKVNDISIATAGSSGTFYVMGAGFADLLNSEHDDLSTTAEITGGSVENAKLIDGNQVELSAMQMDVGINAVNGKEQFDEPIDMAALLPMYPNLVQIVTLADSGIETFADLKGKSVSVGAPGSGVLATNEILFDELDMSFEEDFKPQYLAFDETTNAFRNDEIDAAIFNTAAPASFITDLETTHDVNFISFSDEVIDKFTSENEYFIEDVIPTEAYSSLEEDVPTFAVWIALTADPDLPEDTAYDIVKTVMEGNEFLKDVHEVSKYVTPDNVENIKGVPFHPGAKKYYDEEGISYDE